MTSNCTLLAHTRHPVRNGGELHRHSLRTPVQNNHKPWPPCFVTIAHAGDVPSPMAPIASSARHVYQNTNTRAPRRWRHTLIPQGALPYVAALPSPVDPSFGIFYTYISQDYVSAPPLLVDAYFSIANLSVKHRSSLGRPALRPHLLRC